MSYMIKNFSGRHAVEVTVHSNDIIKKYGAIVSIIQCEASMNFQHDMTAAQARQMAKALIESADEAEAIASEVAA